MARTPQDITDAELAVLQVLWEHGPIQIRRITEVLYPQGTTAQYATVQKLLDRLEAKDCVARDRSPSSHVFSATIDRDELVGRTSPGGRQALRRLLDSPAHASGASRRIIARRPAGPEAADRRSEPGPVKA